MFIRWNSNISAKGRHYATGFGAGFSQQYISATPFYGWYPWVNISPGVGIGTGGASGVAAASGESSCDAPGYMPFVGDSSEDFPDEWVRMRKCIDTGLSTFYLKTKDQGNPTNNDANMIWKIGGVCYYYKSPDLPSGTIVNSLSGGTEIDVSAAEQYATCSGCEPICYALIDCTGAKSEIHTNDNLAAHLGNIVTISGEGSTCWQVVTLSPPCTSVVSVTVVNSYATCAACDPNCCDCQGGMGCQFDPTNAEVDLEYRDCDHPLVPSATSTETFTILGAAATFASCKTEADYIYFRGSAIYSKTRNIPDTGCEGGGGDEPEAKSTDLEIRFHCGTGQWQWRIPRISSAWQRHAGVTNTCSGYEHEGTGDVKVEKITVKNNSYCPSV